MTEKLLQFIWQFGYFNKKGLATTDGEPVTIIFPGTLNTNQGPDFKDARLKIGATTFAGSVELHLKTSHWKQHGHDGDAHYNNVVLHVVYEHDVLFQKPIPVVVLQPCISNVLLSRYESLMQHSTFIPCAATLSLTKPLLLQSWKERLVAERLTRKAQHVLTIFKSTTNHWEETFWRLLARNFGIKVNSDAFEALAATIPVSILAKHKSNIHQLEALLLGQCSLLDEVLEGDHYYSLLQREYRFLKAKYNLKPIVIPILFSRMRPGAFPTVRLAQLAMLIHQSGHLFSKIKEAPNVTDVKKWLHVTANDYWHYHYKPGTQSAYKPKTLGDDMVVNIIINTIVPLLFAYGLHHNNEHYTTKATNWLLETNGEKNSITEAFIEHGLENKSAFDSQALLELKNEYCNNKLCLQCSIGNALLKKCTDETT